MKIYTSRFSNKDLAKADVHCVGIVSSMPKFPTAMKVETNLAMLAPPRSIFGITDRDAFRRRYRQHLDGMGAVYVESLLEKCSRDKKDVVLLCYEDVTCDNPEKNWCHRQYLAEWIEEHLGIKVEEYPDSGNWLAKHTKKEPFDQMSLF